MNNFLISFIERKKQFAVLASVGMSRFQNKKILLIEALCVGIIGSIIGMFGGLILTYTIPYVLSASGLPLDIYYEPKIFVTCFAFGILITLISSIGPTMKASKLNVIDSIKYE